MDRRGGARLPPRLIPQREQAGGRQAPQTASIFVFSVAALNGLTM